MAEPVEWLPDGTPRSARFDDIYRSHAGALAQARHVFLGGCGLPQAWAGRPQWRILETGFGLGLNFLAAWRAWKDDPQRPQILHFVSVEAWPVAAGDLLRSAAATPELEPLARELAAQWWGLVPGFHRLQFEGGRVLLTLCVGEARPLLREQAFAADSVFLDGFDPQRNPAMWALDTLKAVARCCRRGTRLATWSVAGHVRRDLELCGFAVEKVPGLPPKHESLQARFNPPWTLKHAPPQPRAAAVGKAFVVGSGLAGAAVAAALALRGWQVQVLDAAAAAAAGASGLPAGLLAPHTSPDDNLLSRLSRAGVRLSLQQAQMRLAAGRDWQRTGVLQRRFDPRRLPDLGPWQHDWQQPLDEEAASVWHAAAAWVRPAALVQAWLAEPGIEWRGHTPVDRLERHEGQWQALDAAGQVLARADLAVVAAGLDSAGLLPSSGDDPAAPAIRLHAVRGQVSWDLLEAGPALAAHPHNGKGHFLPDVQLPQGRAWLSGSTYVRADRSTQARPEEHRANLERLRLLVPDAAQRLAARFERGEVRAWTGVRCASGDRRPLVGEIEPGLWVSTALGSRGLTFAHLCAELLAARLHAEPLPVPTRLAAALDATRPAAIATRVPATP
ncbi:tRNA (5-methylaminomethyl-2-thiouridine)(34)-methyltransferase MnmD [Ramlibacter tataouinensis]|uniref:tRNA (5-methylaminomethyl-2-thiouridine)(34)-methyltransferase MnmD n=1 Tax=Ramlibacter tataouinensis TaxID=94132 RepID=UPI0022F3DBB9|nr:tRNA (5-methylaminomethyl-2-thiouridine)(34)-methyltransferase MnmD [Ramlibacter tataouinensis]WBY02158.1 tRNA (5-methylaminomethyl-2-thiouridine)(34)-methyltransferase MnmD [Ramlibacter tataouinensis]